MVRTSTWTAENTMSSNDDHVTVDFTVRGGDR
jgi:hypothetical protein